jgi:hypothetical protein
MSNSQGAMSQALGMILDWECNAEIYADFREEDFSGNVFTGHISVIPRAKDWIVESTTRGTRQTFTPVDGLVSTRNDVVYERIMTEQMPTPIALWPCFPLEMFIWGRRNDTWAIGDATEQEDGFLVKLHRITPDPDGFESSVFVERSVKMITALTLGPHKLSYSSIRRQGPRS